MSFGERLYRISRRRRAVALSLVVAFLACIFTLYRPSLVPPGLHARHLQIGTASTELLVATPNLAVGANADDYLTLVNSATLVGNVMVSQQVLGYVGHVLGISPARIQATAPMTANVPRALIDPGNGGFATSLVQSPDHYKLEIQADPSVPILHVYAQGPSQGAAVRLVTAAVQGVTTYLAQTQAANGTRPAQRVTIDQLGSAIGGIANPGAAPQIAILVFVGVLGVCLFAIVVAERIRRGWTAGQLAEQMHP
jgi:hypothetical protein